jgi:hypothetical protein
MTEIDNFYGPGGGGENFAMSEETIRNGQYCVVAYDEHWYRAVIGDFVEDLVNDVHVTLIDYGFDCDVKKN